MMARVLLLLFLSLLASLGLADSQTLRVLLVTGNGGNNKALRNTEILTVRKSGNKSVLTSEIGEPFIYPHNNTAWDETDKSYFGSCFMTQIGRKSEYLLQWAHRTFTYGVETGWNEVNSSDFSLESEEVKRGYSAIAWDNGFIIAGFEEGQGDWVDQFIQTNKTPTLEKRRLGGIPGGHGTNSRKGLRHHTMIKTGNNSFVITGGEDDSSDFFDGAYEGTIDNNGTLRFKTLQPLLTARREHCSFVLANKLFVVGGMNQQVLKTTEYLDLDLHQRLDDSSSWQFGPDLPFPLREMTCESNNAFALIIGGIRGSSGSPSKKVVLMTSDLKFKELGNLKQKRRSHVSVVLPMIEESPTPTTISTPGPTSSEKPAISRRESMTEESVTCTWSDWTSCSYYCGQTPVPTQQQVLVDAQPKSMKALCEIPEKNCSSSIKCTGN